MSFKIASRNILVLMTLAIFLMGCNKEKVISIDELPTKVTDYVTTHFPEHEILQASIDRDRFKKFYDVLLNGSFNLEFNKKGEITEIDGISKLPDSVIPSNILSYVNTNYPENVITDWELEKKTQEIMLDIGLELIFNLNGEFIKIDQ